MNSSVKEQKKLIILLSCILVILLTFAIFIFVAGSRVTPNASNANNVSEASTPVTQETTYSALRNSAAGQAVEAFARQHRLSYDDYPESLVELLQKNPETEKFVLEYPLYDGSATGDLSSYDLTSSIPLFMQWDQQWGYMTYGSDVAGLTGCGPVCLSMAACYLTGDDAYAPDKMLQFAIDNGYCVPGSGSAWTLISEGGTKLGFDVTEIPLQKQRIMDNLAVNNPIICIMGPGDFTTSGHFIVLSGCEDGMIKINDPNSYANSEKLWSYEEIADQIRNLWVIRN